ncbi:sensor domain-containing diguanylate cyclase [Scleromatobacter humisilvae]|uniref:diguanylate cyclase n=1 Tax=Scleromatobacter humisilvae TaxID=2897159 RepID=A0A9X1YEM8_9BURK|nr:GGDEF domain-containing protein [Scleromatobacter humisilvae]MCK9684608.1 GGDEF domain-containing protein [Scleromatobacter humisilvae]
MQAPATPSPADANLVEVTRDIGFAQCVQALKSLLMATPIGWLLVAWFGWSRAPHERMLCWLGGFFCAWLVSIVLLRSMARAGPSRARHLRHLMTIAVLDGTCWGAVVWLVAGFNATLDPWLGAVLCGVAAINAPVYITYFRAYAALMGALWATVMLAALARPPHAVEQELVYGLTIFCGLLTYHMRSIAQRVLDGIGLQLSNASLASQLSAALQLVQHEAGTDSLTGQPNRRALDELLKQQVSVSRSTGRTFSVLLLDIDHFKLVNDTHGHGAGDDTLCAFAQRVREHLRQGDTCARYGGEEFVVVLPGTTLVAALEVAERLRQGVAEASLMSVPLVRTTVSIGAAQYLPGETVEQLLARADTAVYAAKRGGRNQVRVPEEAATA